MKNFSSLIIGFIIIISPVSPQTPQAAWHHGSIEDGNRSQHRPLPISMKPERPFTEVLVEWRSTMSPPRKALVLENLRARIDFLGSVAQLDRPALANMIQLLGQVKPENDSTIVDLLIRVANLEKRLLLAGRVTAEELLSLNRIDVSTLGCASSNSNICGEIRWVRSRLYNGSAPNYSPTWYKEGASPGSGLWWYTEIGFVNNGTQSATMFVEVANEPTGWSMFWYRNLIFYNYSPEIRTTPGGIYELTSGDLLSGTQSPNAEQSTSVTYQLYWDRVFPIPNELLHTYSEELRNDITAPTASVNALPPIQYVTTFTVSWTANDPGVGASGIGNILVQKRVNTGPWEDWQLGTHHSAPFTGIFGNTYYFRANARDNVGHESPLAPGNGDTYTILQISPPTAFDATSVNGTSFKANWSGVSGATGYRLDVSTVSSFSSYVSGYENLDVGNVASRLVSGLSNTTKYYYRVRAYSGGSTSDNSNTISVTTTTLVEQVSSNIPTEYHLYQNYPNPFNPVTTIEFSIPKSASTTLTMYDVLGLHIETVINEHLAAGRYRAQWDGFNFPSGVYLYRIQSGEFIDVKKLILLK